MDVPAPPSNAPASDSSNAWPATNDRKRTMKRGLSLPVGNSGYGSSNASDGIGSDGTADCTSWSDGQLTPASTPGGGGADGRDTNIWSSSRGEDQYVHVSGWYDTYGCCPCSKTETILLACPPSTPSDRELTTVDITTGHAILTYMEEVARDPERVGREWETLQTLDTSESPTTAASCPVNRRKNRSSSILPYDSNRVRLQLGANVSSSDFINASKVVDDDPSNPVYIVTQGPLPHTVADFWQMVWESGSTTIINLSTELDDDGAVAYHRYWPEEGAELYYHFEVCVVSEHQWCADYVIRSLYVKNVRSRHSRTVTLFHLLTWPHHCPPSSVLPLLDMRRKLNKSYKSHSRPIIVHCSDGGSRSGAFCLIDMVLKRIARRAKEIDIAATAEHIRDQRQGTMDSKENFEFAFLAIATEIFDLMNNSHQ